MGVKEQTTTLNGNQVDRDKGNYGIAKEVLVIAQEIKIVQSLACNDITKRNRQLRKLRKWLQIRANSSFRFTEADFMRIWKGLYYTMWMSDKPLVQEELAEQLGGLMHCFEGQTELSIGFFTAFIKIICNEWFGIDQWRVDKFLMLMRRMLRHLFIIMKSKKWKEEHIDMFNEHMWEGLFTNKPSKGLMMHYMEIFLEELAKIANGDIAPEAVNLLIEPFVKLIINNDDSKLVSHCKIHIFHHLLYQSPAGREYSEKYEAWKSMGFPSSSLDNIEKIALPEEEEPIEESQEIANDLLDPRAGNVDIYIPELPFSVNEIVKNIEHEMKTVDISTKRRKMLKKLLSNLERFERGEFPLGVKTISKPQFEPQIPLIHSKIEKLENLENDMYKTTRMLKKLNKRKRRNLLKSLNFEAAEEDNVDEMIEKALPKEYLKRKGFFMSENNNDMIENIENGSIIPKKRRKMIEGRMSNSSSSLNNKSKENKNIIKQNRKKKIKTLPDTSTNSSGEKCETSLENTKISGKDVVNKIPKITQSNKAGNCDSSVESAPIEKKILFENPKNKSSLSKKSLREDVRHLLPSRKKQKNKVKTRLVINPLCSTKENKNKELQLSVSSLKVMKRVKIALKHNQEQKPSEYIRQIKRSPKIPYDASKKPTKGLLKPNSMPSPINPFYKKKIGFKFANENI